MTNATEHEHTDPLRSEQRARRAAAAQSGIRATLLGILVNLVLALVKVSAGIFGHSYALIADGIESTADILTSMIVWAGLKFSVRPPDREHPYGHGKAESLVGLVVALALLGAAALIAVQSVGEIRTPHLAPRWFTLPVLLVVVVTKESLSRFVLSKAETLESGALQGRRVASSLGRADVCRGLCGDHDRPDRRIGL